MELFRKRIRLDCVVRKFEGKMIKAKQSAESARKPVCIVTMDVPITKKIKALLPNRIVSFLGQDTDKEAQSGEPAYNSMNMTWEMVVSMKIFGFGNHSKTSDAELEKGFDNDDVARLKIVKCFVKEDVEYLQIKFQLSFDKKTWAWGGCVFGDGEIVVEVQPFQGELPLGEGVEVDSDEDEDEDCE